jgi:hypothetical protein
MRKRTSEMRDMGSMPRTTDKLGAMATSTSAMVAVSTTPGALRICCACRSAAASAACTTASCVGATGESGVPLSVLAGPLAAAAAAYATVACVCASAVWCASRPQVRVGNT